MSQSRRPFLVLAAAALVGACALPEPLPPTARPARPPRSWTAADLEAPRAAPAVPVTPDSAAIPPRAASPGVYPERESLAGPAASTGISRPPEMWRPSGEGGRPLRAQVVPERALGGLPAVGGEIPVRRSVWPGNARIIGRDSAGVVLLATEWFALSSLGDEVRCKGYWPRQVPARLEARLSVDAATLVIRPRLEIAAPAGAAVLPTCLLGSVAQDRVNAFGSDVWMAVHQAARRAMPVPVRPID